MKPLPPIYSRYDDDPERREAIERFIVDLSEALDELQDLHMESQWEQLEEHARTLAGDAEDHGYPALVETASAAAVAAGDGESEAETSQKHLVELTELVQRIRRGSRGAA